MKAAILYKSRDLRVESIEKPSILDGEVLIRVKASGICGSDLAIYKGTRKLCKEPIILGHEFSGIVEKIGRGVKYLNIGDRVAIDPNITCGKCYFCRMSERNYYCINRRVIGGAGWLNGGFSEFVRAPEKVVYKLSDKISFEEATLIEPIACSVRGIDRVNIQSGDCVVILGAGPMGLIMLQLARLSGASKIIITDVVGTRLKKATRLGADFTINSKEKDVCKEIITLTEGIGADIVIEAVGSSKTVEKAISFARRGGGVNILGVSSPEDIAKIKPYELYEKEITLTTTFCNPFTFQRTIRLLEENRIHTKELISHTFSLDQIGQAFDVMENEVDRCKVIIKI